MATKVKFNKEKVKEFINKNTGVIATGVMLGGAYFLGYKTGSNMTELKINNGLHNVSKFEPELIPTLERAIEAFKKANNA